MPAAKLESTLDVIGDIQNMEHHKVDRSSNQELVDNLDKFISSVMASNESRHVKDSPEVGPAYSASVLSDTQDSEARPTPNRLSSSIVLAIYSCEDLEVDGPGPGVNRCYGNTSEASGHSDIDMPRSGKDGADGCSSLSKSFRNTGDAVRVRDYTGGDLSDGTDFTDPMNAVLGAIRSSNTRQSVRRDISQLLVDPGDLSRFTELLSYGTFGTLATATMNDEANYGEEVVVKRIFRDDVNHEDLLDTLDLMAHCAHPHVLGLMGYMHVNDTISIITERSSQSLHGILHNDPAGVPFDTGKVLDWSLQIASGIRYLHQFGGVIIRNLNSYNVLIYDESSDDFMYGGEDDEKNQQVSLKISDYCTSILFDHGIPVSEQIHKVAWMAPEVLNCGEVSHSADVWSLGVIIWEMLTRTVPYCGCNAATMFGRICEGETLTLPAARNRPEFWGKVLKPCFRSRPSNRIGIHQVMITLGRKFSEFSQFEMYQEPGESLSILPEPQNDYHKVLQQDKPAILKKSYQSTLEAFIGRFKSSDDERNAPPTALDGSLISRVDKIPKLADINTPWELSAVFGALNRRATPKPPVQATRRISASMSAVEFSLKRAMMKSSE